MMKINRKYGTMSQTLLDLVIFRHGEAQPFVVRDEERALTNYGQSRAREQAQLLAELGFKPDEIIHSPFVRTTQTADICQEVLQAPLIRSDNCLLHGGYPEQVPLVFSPAKSILLVSHMPLVGRLVQYLCPRSEVYGLPVAGFVRLSTNLETLESELIYDGRLGS